MNASNAGHHEVPISDPCLSYWQRTTRGFNLLNSNRSNKIPVKRKYVIIGSGLSGSLTAFKLVEAGVKGSDILILEAREAASGASARNAGHVRPDAFRGFLAYQAVHGSEQALKIITNERLVLEEVNKFVEKYNVDCDFDYTTTFDVCMTEDFAAYEAACIRAFERAGGDISHIRFYEGKEAQEKTRVKSAICAYEWPAGSTHPAKLTQWLLKKVVSEGVQLSTHCPVTKVKRADSSDSKDLWQVCTSRGVVTTPIVIHCTNAHAGFLLPDIAHHLTPNRAQAHSIIPGPSFSGGDILKSTFSLRYSRLHFYSIIQRKDDGTLILGVSRHNPTLSESAKAGIVGFDDSHFSNEILQDGLTQFNKLFPDATKGLKAHGEGIDHAWTGIIGMTVDSVPFVGALEGLPGQYICAGHNGHGMARIFTCAPGVAKLVLGGQWSDTGLPECFQISKERLNRLSGISSIKAVL